MRVTLDRGEFQAGLVFKKTNYRLEVTLEFTEEEVAIIRKHGYHEYKLISSQRDPREDLIPWFVKDFIKRPVHTYNFTDFPLSVDFEERLKANLQSLKDMIEASTVTTGKQTFEL